MPVAVASASPKVSRVQSIDVIRGVVMVLMAIDHVRVYSGLPAGGPTAGIFFTRWVTHFCAPAFVFLAGTSAFFAGRTRTPSELSRLLVVRGAWLAVLELTLIRICWTFNLDYAHYVLLGVIWMLGVCMVLMAPLARLPLRTIATFGLIVILAQNAIGLAGPHIPESAVWTSAFFQVLWFGGVFRFSPEGPAIAVLYSIVPWIGVMASGYAFGAILLREPASRDRACLWIGLSLTSAFLILGSAGAVFGGAANGRPFLFRLLSQQKYPASQLFLMMTLGPTIALMPVAGRLTGAIGRFFSTFGRVPFFYYLLHIPLIHASALVVSLVREGRVDPWLFGNHPMMPPNVPPGYRWSLPLLYLDFAIVIALLYLPCRWYAGVKARRPHGRLQYL